LLFSLFLQGIISEGGRRLRQKSWAADDPAHEKTAKHALIPRWFFAVLCEEH
jgi:hypothetical protein